jgi:hypothetical protein
MTTPPPPRTPCTCLPYATGHHGILLHADQVDDLLSLLTTIEYWLLQASDGVHHDLHQYLTAAHRPDPARQLLTDQLDDLLHRLTTTPHDWMQHADGDLHEFLTAHRHDPVDRLLEQLAATAGHITRSGHDPRHAWTPC